MEFWERMEKRRLELGWAQKEAAYKLRVTEQYVSQWENPKNTKRPSYKMLIKIASVYECSTDYLLGLTEDIRPAPNEELPKGDAEMLNYLASMSDNGKQALREFAKTLYEVNSGQQEYELMANIAASYAGEDEIKQIKVELNLLAPKLGWDTALREVLARRVKKGISSNDG